MTKVASRRRFYGQEAAILYFGGAFFFLTKQARFNFLIPLQPVRIEFSVATPGFRLARVSAEVMERARGGEVMSLCSRRHRPAHIFALGDNKPIVLPDKASVCTVMGIKPGISHVEIG